MSKFRKVIIILGSLTIFIVASIATFLGLSFAGAIVTDPIELTYQILDESKFYDGTPLMASECELIEGQLINGHFVSFEFKGSQTNVGTGQSDVNVKIVDEQLHDVTKQYSIKVENGNLNVLEREISIKVEDCSVPYSGEEIYFDNYTVTSGSLVPGHQVKAKSKVGVINVNDTPSTNDLLPAIYDVLGNDVTANYKVDFSVGKIEITPRNLEIKPKDYSKVYDGEALVCEDYEILSGSLVDKHFIEVTYKTKDGKTASITNVNDSTRTEINTYKIYTYVGEEKVDVTDNYYVNTISQGAFEIQPRTLVLVGEEKEFTYNGNEQSLKDIKTVQSHIGLVEGETVEVTYDDDKAVNVTNEPKKVKIVDYKISSSNDNYEVTTIDGSLSIKKEKLDIYLADINKEYTGLKLEVQPSEMIKTKICNVSNALVAIKESVVNELMEKHKYVGSYTYTVDKNQIEVHVRGDLANDNFDINIIGGTINVSKKVINVSLNSFTQTYDGNVFSKSSSEVVKCDTSGVSVTISNESLNRAFAGIKNAGVYSYLIPASDMIFTYNSQVLSEDSIAVTVTAGSVLIEKKAATITLGDYEKDYDGNAATYDESKNQKEGFLDTDTVTITGASQAIAKFKDAGVYSYTIGLNDVSVSNNAKDNYNISIVPGVVTIKSTAKGTIIAHIENIYAFTEDSFDASAYSGNLINLLVIDVFTPANEGDVLSIDGITVTLSGKKITYSGSFTVKNAAGNDVTSNYATSISQGQVIFLVS